MALTKRGCDRRDLRLPARPRPLSRNDHFSASRYALRRLRPPAPALLADRAPPPPATQPARYLQPCVLRTTVPPPDTRISVIPPAIPRAGGCPAAVARLPALPPAR